MESSQEIEGYKLITSSFRDLESKELRELADRLRNQSPNSIITLISISNDKAFEFFYNELYSLKNLTQY